MTHRLDTAAFDREVRALLIAARWSAAELEQVLATTARIDLGDADSWLREWTAAGGQAWAAARGGDAGQRYLHAASYYGAALALIESSEGLVEEAALWRRQRECWDRAVLGLGGERVEIPLRAGSLPGYFVPAGQGSRPVIVVDSGGRMVTSQAWAQVGAAARARGYHFLTFDGPGRQEALHLRGLVLRDDWDTVLGSVANLLISRPDVDSHRMGLVGLELGSYGAACALLAEHRFAAAILLPGIHDASRLWLDRLPEGARLALLDEDAERFARELHLASLFAPEFESRLRHDARAFDGTGSSLYALFRRIHGFRLDGRPGELTTPTLVCDAFAGEPWAGQASETARRLGAASRLSAGRTADDAVGAWLDSLF
ncbi:MAG TPA: alpha/beta hydrolase [Solirubrobacteraceae bacterium]|nr:alpha/beta hydrolase [Solirubrobacteraceae bacterium]